MRSRRAVTVLAVAACVIAAACNGDTEPAAPSVVRPGADEDQAGPDGSLSDGTDPTPTTSTTEPPPTAAASSSIPDTSLDAVPDTGDDGSRDVSCVDELDLRAAAALVVWPAAEPTQWEVVVDAVAMHGVGGVLLMRPSDWGGAEVTRRLDELESASRHGLVVATDEEGGDVQRLRMLGTLPSQRAVADEYGEDLDGVRRLVAQHGELVREVGVDVVFGPVVDVEPEPGSGTAVPLARSRFFPGSPEAVADVAGAYLAGWHDAGIVPTLKHFPGHGAASGDTHDVDGVTPDLDSLRQRDLVPYELLAPWVERGTTAVMVGHLIVPGLTDGLPASRSGAAIDLLRSLPGHDDALVVTDALGMAAVGMPEPQAAVAALAAGVDVALFTDTSVTGAVIDAIVAAVEAGELDERSVRTAAGRVMTLLERDGHTCDAPAP